MERQELAYQLTKEEIEEMLLCLDWRREGLFKSVNLWVISILGTVFLAAYMRNPEHFYLFVMLLVIIFLLFALWYGPRRRRRKTAEKMIKKGSSFRLVLGDGYLAAADAEKKAKGMQGKMTFYISENLYILKTQGEIYALPKRILNREQEEKLVKTAERYQADTVNVVIKKE